MSDKKKHIIEGESSSNILKELKRQGDRQALLENIEEIFHFIRPFIYLIFVVILYYILIGFLQ